MDPVQSQEQSRVDQNSDSKANRAELVDVVLVRLDGVQVSLRAGPA